MDSKRTVVFLHYSKETAKEQVIDKITAYYESGIEGECILFDAIGDEQLYELVDGKYSQTLIYNMSDVEFTSVSQLKNVAVNFASNDSIIFIPCVIEFSNLAGVLRELTCKEDVDAVETFEKLAVATEAEVSLFEINKTAFETIGGFNEKLGGGEDYELLLRACDMDCSKGFRYVTDSSVVKPVFQENYETYAYVLGKYSDRLRKSGLFDTAVALRYNEAENFGIAQHFVARLEQMISGGRDFECIDKVTRPVAIVVGREQLCYGVLDEFALQLMQGLRMNGQNVLLVDATKLRKPIYEVLNGRYRAVISFQSEALFEQTEDGTFVADLIRGPKFNMTYDHPMFIAYYMMLPIKNYYVLTQDMGYEKFLNTYFGNIKGAYHFSPAGTGVIDESFEAQYKYDISFVGTYNDYRKCLPQIKQLDKEERSVALEMLNVMKHNPDLTPESVLTDILERRGIRLSDREFVVKLHHMHEVVRIIMFYYREKVIRKIIESGIVIDVFSDTFSDAPFADSDNLVIHNAVTYEEGLQIMSQSRISLNIMSWHKGDMTERISNAMLNKSVCLTDKTDYLIKHFKDGENISIFELTKLDELPGNIRQLLQDEEKLRNITGNAYDKAMREHTWTVRAQELMQLMDSLEFNINDYNDYYERALNFERNGFVEDAYYNYRMAMYLAGDEQIKMLIKQQFDSLCGYANVQEYNMGKALFNVVVERVKKCEYEISQGFLNEQLYDMNKIAAKLVLTEMNMLLSMLLEIVLCEKNRLVADEFKAKNTLVKYDCDVDKFNEVYKKLKFMARRVWFGESYRLQMEINDIIEEYDVSSDMLAVILKNSIRPEFWVDAFSRVVELIKERFPDIAKDICVYISWLESINDVEKEKCTEPDEYNNEAEFARFYCDSESFSKPVKDTDIAFIFCSNDELYENECVNYLKHLVVPKDMTMQIISVWNASGMAAGYNRAMKNITSKYKIYIHHDTFIVEKRFLELLLSGFEDNETGLIGVVGSVVLDKSGFWWKEENRMDFRMNMYQDVMLNILKSVSIEQNGRYEEVMAIDGVLMATNTDIPWREDLFDHWHFYDISQCYEFRKHGLKAKIINSDNVLVMHEVTAKKDPKQNYEKYCDIFLENYTDDRN